MRIASCSRRIAFAAGAFAWIAGCSLESVRNEPHTGFDAYLIKLEACHLTIGSTDVSRWIRSNPSGVSGYDYFMDATSKLYYKRITPDDYRIRVTARLGEGASNEQSFDCIFGNLRETQ